MKYLLFLLGFIIFQPSYSQLSKGIKVGMSASNIIVNENIDGSLFRGGESVTGYHVGVLARYKLGVFFIQPEALFTSSGGKINITPPQDVSVVPSPYNLEISYNKIDVPLLVGMRLVKLLRVQAGPTGSYLLSADQTNSASGAVSDIIANYKQFSIGYQAGVGLDLGKLMLDLRYEDNAGKFRHKIGSFSTDQRNRQYLLSIGMLF